MKCAASITFDRAPFVDVRCSRPDGHDGAHETVVRVPTKPWDFAAMFAPRDPVDVALTWRTTDPTRPTEETAP